MGITPRGASIDESFELTGQLRPVRWCYRYDDVCLFPFVHDSGHVIFDDTFCRMVARPAALAEPEGIVVDADAFGWIVCGQLFGHKMDNGGGRTCFDRTAVND